MHHHNHKDGPASDHNSHDKHAGHSAEMFRDKFWLTVVLAVPTVVWSEMIQQWFGYAAPRFPGSDYMAAVFGTVVFFYGRSEEHTSELQSRGHLVCRLLLETKT